MSVEARIHAGAAALGVLVDTSMAAQLARYAQLFMKWNQRINLSSTRSLDPLLTRHILDCVAVLPHIPDTARRAIDVGSGGGLPGCILAICRPDVSLIALEPIHKKHAFLMAAQRELGLANFQPLAERVEVHHARVIGDAPERGYDLAVSRATFALGDWLTMGSSLVRPGGLVLAMEAMACSLPSGAERHPYEIPGDSSRIRAIIRFQQA